MEETSTSALEGHLLRCVRVSVPLTSLLLPPPHPSSPLFFCLVTQLQSTLASVQELLLQQQQKVQELTQELAASKVPLTLYLPPYPTPLGSQGASM